jgi:putative transposase
MLREVAIPEGVEVRQCGDARARKVLEPWPVPLPEDWVARVNEPQTEAELAGVRQAVVRGSPFGSLSWQEQTARRLRLDFTLRPRGRPRKASPAQPE